MKYLISILILPLFALPTFGQTRGVSFDNGTRTVIQNDLNQTFASLNVTGQMQRNGVNIVDAARTVSTGAGLSGGGDLSANRTLTFAPSTFVDNVTFFDGSQATRTWTFNLSGATDPVWSIGNGIMNLSAGTLQQAGVNVALESRQLTIAGTANEITSSAGAQTLAGDRTWTLSLPTALTFSGKTIAGGTYASPSISGSITFPDDTRQTFNPGANNAGLNVGSHAGDPTGVQNGDVWYNSNLNALRTRIGGANVSLGAGGGSGTIAGPASTTDSAFMLWDGTDGLTAKDSNITSPNGNDLVIPGSIIATGDTPGLLSIITEGVTDDAFEGEITSADPTADRTWTFPDRSGIVIVSSDTATDGQALVWDEATGTWVASTIAGGGSVTWDAIGDATASSVIALGAFTNQLTSTLDNGTVLSIYATDADNGADTVGLEIAFNDAADANSIFFRAVSDADGTPSTIFSVTGVALTTSLPSTFSGGVSTTGGLTLQTGNDPDVPTEGGISYDANGDYIRVNDGANQVAIARKIESIQFTVIAPNDLADAQRDGFAIWKNVSGLPFVVTGWDFESGADNTDCNIEETDADGANNATVDAVSITTDGTGLFYASDTTITAATIENGHRIIIDFDDTDTPSYVKGVIYGFYDADVN